MVTLKNFSVLIGVLLSVTQVHAGSAERVFDQVSPSVVVVRGLDAEGKSIRFGSGVVIRDRVVVTNCHVLEGAQSVKVVYADTDHDGTILHADWERDVCSVSIPGLDAPTAEIGTTQTLKVGATVFAIGAPRGLELTLSEGIVSGFRRVNIGRYIQITAAISLGSSGGGLFDSHGRLIGMPSFFIEDGQQLNFAVPVEWIVELPKRHLERTAGSVDKFASLQLATRLTSKESWSELSEHASRWVLSHPTDAEAWFYLGRATAELDVPRSEIEALKVAKRTGGPFVNPGPVSAKAIEAYQKAVRINPDHADAWYFLGVAYNMTSAGLIKSRQAFENALRADPNHAKSWYEIGQNPFNTVKEKIKAYKNAVHSEPRYAEAWLKLGSAYVEYGDTDMAIEAYRKALQIRAEYAEAWFGLAETYAQTGSSNQAIKAYQQALLIAPDYAWALYGIGKIYKSRGQRDEASAVHKRLKAIAPAWMVDQFFEQVILQ